VVIGGAPVVQTRSQRVALDAAAYDPATNAWHRLPPVPSRPGWVTDDLNAVATPAGIDAWVLWERDVSTTDGGTVTSGVDLSRFDPATGRWNAVDLVQPKVTGDPLWTGTEVIIPASQLFDGDVPGPEMPAADGWRMNPATDAWQKMPRGPVYGLSASSIWTGAALLSFDSGLYSTGPTGTTYPGQAAVWNPTTGRWTRLPTAPNTGGGLSVVWTGSQLIEWGLMFPSRQVNAAEKAAGLSFGP
jgi:hypothetical protein